MPNWSIKESVFHESSEDWQVVITDGQTDESVRCPLASTQDPTGIVQQLVDQRNQE
jgi:hypothetical protein